MRDSRCVGITCTILVDKSCIEFHVACSASRSCVLVRDVDVVVGTRLADGGSHTVIIDSAVHSTTAGEKRVVCGVLSVGTALTLVCPISEVRIRSTASCPCPVVWSNVACSCRIGITVGCGHVSDIDVFVWVVLLDRVVGVGTATCLRTVTTVVRRDVLTEDNVSWTGRLGWVLDNGFFFKKFRFDTVVLRGQPCH